MTKHREVIKRDLQEACWIGEDGAIAIDGRFGKRHAWIAMRKLIKTDVGEFEANELKIDDLQIGYFHLAEEEIDSTDYKDDGIEWFVSRSMEGYLIPNTYPVWVYWG